MFEGGREEGRRRLKGFWLRDVSVRARKREGEVRTRRRRKGTGEREGGGDGKELGKRKNQPRSSEKGTEWHEYSLR